VTFRPVGPIGSPHYKGWGHRGHKARNNFVIAFRTVGLPIPIIFFKRRITNFFLYYSDNHSIFIFFFFKKNKETYRPARPIKVSSSLKEGGNGETMGVPVKKLNS
jgi:hypothetical protein